jgi:calmodulin
MASWSVHDTNAFSIAGHIVLPAQRSRSSAPAHHTCRHPPPAAATFMTVPTDDDRRQKALRIATTTATTTTSLSMVSAVMSPPDVPAGEEDNEPPGDNGVYDLTNESDHASFLAEHPDDLVVLKVYAPWCRACKALSPKFASLARDDALSNTPIVFAQLSIQHNKDFIKSLGVLALPTVQFYVAGRLVDTFACGPSKFPTLKRKLAALIADNVGIDGHLKPSAYEQDDDNDDDSVASTEEQSDWSDEDRAMIANIPYFTKLSLADRDSAMEQAHTMTFPAGAVILREGAPGDTFFVIQEGEVELCQQTNRDPLSGYLGTVINQLEKGNFFGERALITGEMNAASVRAATDVKVYAFHKDTFPASSVLSGRTREMTPNLSLDDKYGVTSNILERAMVKQLRDLSLANQVRGSVNTPRSLEEDDLLAANGAATPPTTNKTPTLSSSYLSSITSSSSSIAAEDSLIQVNKDDIFSLVTRMKRIRHVGNCFDYIRDTGATWPSARRQLLVDRLSTSQKSEFVEIFEIMDVNHDGRIDLAELRRLKESIGEEDDDEDDVFATTAAGSKAMEKKLQMKEMTFDDYMGLMAEAEFYTLFREIFQQLDRNRSGFLKAIDLEKVLCGVRDLISDDRNSVIDVEDKDMLIDYEQFTRMLLGTTLVDKAQP